MHVPAYTPFLPLDFPDMWNFASMPSNFFLTTAVSRKSSFAYPTRNGSFFLLSCLPAIENDKNGVSVRNDCMYCIYF